VLYVRKWGDSAALTAWLAPTIGVLSVLLVVELSLSLLAHFKVGSCLPAVEHHRPCVAWAGSRGHDMTWQVWHLA